MKVVSERTQADVDRERAAAQLSWALRDLAANLLRVIRGAGKAYLIPDQTVEVIKALKVYHDAVGTFPPDREMAKMLRVGQERPPGQFNDATLNRRASENVIVRGALQIAASRLIGQSTQGAMGEHELYDGIRDPERLWKQEETERRAAQTRELQSSARPGKPYPGSSRSKRASKPKDP